MKSILIIVSFLLALPVLGQREGANWYFGDKAGLSFTSGSPTPLLDGEIDSLEGCATISSPEGDLLFYTNGVTVWNRVHQIMENGDGLAGSDSSTQSAIIVPDPGNGNRFYIFTTDAFLSYAAGGGTGLNYSIVTMNGLGSVTTKNINLLPAASEKITAVTAADGENFWIIAQFENKFYSYLLTSSGLAAPVVSTVPYTVSELGNIRGSMKVSPKGDKLGIAHMLIADRNNLGGAIILYDFNKLTGVVSNENIIDESIVFYGIEFSSDSSKLYASGKGIDGNETDDFFVYQYDLDAPSISGSRYEIAYIEDNLTSDLGGSLQLSVDKKIYYSIPQIIRRISVINRPNLPENFSNFSLNTVDLGNRSPLFGLPPFVQSFFESIFSYEGTCFGDITQFTVFPEANVSSITWDFGDPASGANNTSTVLNPSHEYTAAGTYVVTVDVVFSDGRQPKQFIEIVEISPVPNAGDTIVLVQCDTDGVDDGRAAFNLNEAFSGNNSNASSLEATFYRTAQDASDGVNALDPLGYRNESNGQIIFAQVSDDANCADALVNVRLDVKRMSDAGTITLDICAPEGQTTSNINLDDTGQTLLDQYGGDSIAFYLTESDGILEMDPVTGEVEVSNADQPELYFRIETMNDCETIGGILFNISSLPEVVSEEVILCDPDIGVQLTALSTAASYQWSTGEITQEITVFQTGTYTVTLSTGLGCETVSTYNVIGGVPIVLDVVVEDFQQDNCITINTNSDTVGSLSYSINGGSTFQNESVFKPVSPGVYNIVVTDNACSEVSTTVAVRGAPRFFTPNGDGYNDRWHVAGARALGDLELFIFDRFGKLISTQNNRTSGWDGNYNGEPLPTGTFWYKIMLENEVFTGYFTLIRR